MTPNANETYVIEVENLRKWFPIQQGLFETIFQRDEPEFLHAVDDVSFYIREGEILGLVGESGSGKTTTGMTIIRLHEPTGGIVRFMGQDITHLKGDELKSFRYAANIVFQNPYESLNIRFTVHDSVYEPLRLHRVGDEEQRRAMVIRALERAELHPPEDFFWRYPFELSGGQQQRVAIARAIVLEPKFLVADEPVSMLDVSIRAGVLNLLKRLCEDMHTSMLYISHDLATVRYICQRTATMYAGQLVELGNTETIIKRPFHPYTQLLTKAIPEIDVDVKRERVLLEGEVPNLIHPPPGCRFHPRCPQVMDICSSAAPELQEVEDGHWASCHLY